MCVEAKAVLFLAWSIFHALCLLLLRHAAHTPASVSLSLLILGGFTPGPSTLLAEFVALSSILLLRFADVAGRSPGGRQMARCVVVCADFLLAGS